MQLHSHNYRTAEPYKDLIVIVIGNGSSARDISKEISHIAKEVHQVYRNPDIQFGKPDKQKNTWLHPMIKRAYDDGKVEFFDGSFVYANAIIHCTGYKYHIPFLRTSGIVSVNNHRVGPCINMFSVHSYPLFVLCGIAQQGNPDCNDRVTDQMDGESSVWHFLQKRRCSIQLKNSTSIWR